jgi:hypothetical protein
MAEIVEEKQRIELVNREKAQSSPGVPGQQMPQRWQKVE